MKKILSLILCMTMVLSLFTIVPLSVSAEGIDTASLSETSGDYEYQILEDDTAEITGYYGSDSELIIPSMLDGYTVTSIGNSAFYKCSSLTSVTIPNSVTSIGVKAFFGCTSLTSITIPDSVTSIGKEAFYWCESLKSITIPNSVTSIGDGAFEGCTSLKEINVTSDNSKYSSKDGVLFNKDKTEIIKYPEGKTDTSYTIPNSVTSIGREAFSHCTSLESITIPNSVTNMGYYAFWYCESLKNVTIGTGITGISYYAFAYCANITNVTIPNSVCWIGGGAFLCCNNLAKITIPNSVTSIGSGAFDYTAWYKNQPDGVFYINKIVYDYKGNMPENTSIVLKDDTLSIADGAFYDYTNLASITIPDSVTRIGNDAFESCTNLENIVIGKGVNSYGFDMFRKCTNVKTITINSNIIGVLPIEEFTMLKSINIGDDVTDHISILFDCKTLEAINVSGGNSMYSSLDGVLFSKDRTRLVFYPRGKAETFYTIPDSVIDVADSAFEDCTSLESITIPDSVINVDDGAFDGTAWYEKQPDGLVYAGKVAYSYKGEMPENTSITLKDGTLSISRRAFFCKSDDFGGSSNLVSVVIPSSVVVIRTGALYLCKKLKTFNVSDDNTMYSSQDGVLFNKDKTELIQYPIGKAETSYTIPNSVTSIEQFAFCGCSSLLDITIPDSITNIGYQAFHNTAWYNNQPDGLIYAGKVAYEYKGNMPKGTSITLEDGTTSISPCAFGNKYGLNSIVIPKGVTNIGYESFYQCLDLTKVTIPNSVTSIDDWAFFWCQNLKSVTIPSSVTNIGDKAFGYNYGGKTEGFIIYGTKGTEAERYANENEFKFVEVKEHIDKDTKIKVDVAGDVTLNVEKPSKQEESKIKELLDKNENLIVAHDITLLKDKTPVQPENIATVRIPIPQDVDSETLKVYRINDDNTKTDMNAVFENNSMAFLTDHFSTYALVATKAGILGDVDKDGSVTIVDATYIQKYLAKIITEDEIDLSVADTDRDGIVSIVDATQIQKYLAHIIDHF